MFTLTMTVWILVAGVGDPVRGPVMEGATRYMTRAACEQKGRDDQWKVALLIQELKETAGSEDTVHQVEAICEFKGREA